MVLKTVWRTVYIFIYLFLVFHFTFFSDPTFYLLLSVAIKVLTNSFNNNKKQRTKIEKQNKKTRLYSSTYNIIDNNKIAFANITKGSTKKVAREGKAKEQKIIQITLSNVSFCRQCFVCYCLFVLLSVCVSVSWLHLLSLRTYFCVWNNTFVPFSLKCVSQNGFIVLNTFRCCSCYFCFLNAFLRDAESEN